MLKSERRDYLYMWNHTGITHSPLPLGSGPCRLSPGPKPRIAKPNHT
jgi:hypothetical protein